MSKQETITLDQLAIGLREIGYIAGDIGRMPSGSSWATFRVDNPRGVAEAIFRRFREPEYEPGRAYVSKYGTLYYRIASGKWRDCSTGNVVAHEHPSRPLTKLVPEDG